ncbi:hypothetical protein DB32_007007 [Sandaracinus amylolyticus]|uniref:Uncharacterized protein n=2 Tax=Sandaracinus amylolyticus TaxID=927083 RepID=A0A0F6W8A7_9BACT|nr:hypothetical protein DB32_007007 [Sandaracinus amylolyticus]
MVAAALAPAGAEAQLVVALGAAGAVAELDDEDRAELELIRAKEDTSVAFYVSGAVFASGGVPAVIWGAVTYADDGDVWGVIALSIGTVACVAAVAYFAVALGYDFGADGQRHRWLRESGLVVDVALHDGGGGLTLAGTF